MGLRYLFTFIRINKFYFIFLICQMILSLALLVYVNFSKKIPLNQNFFRHSSILLISYYIFRYVSENLIIYSLLNPVVLGIEIVLTLLIIFDLAMRIYLLRRVNF